MYYWDQATQLTDSGYRRVSVVVRRMYYWDFSQLPLFDFEKVSVVVRRMYYWDNDRFVTDDDLSFQ